MKSPFKVIALILFAIGYGAYTEHVTHAFSIARITGNYRIIPGAVASVPGIVYQDLYPVRQSPWTVDEVVRVTGTRREVVAPAFAQLLASEMTDSDIADFEDAVDMPESERF